MSVQGVEETGGVVTLRPGTHAWETDEDINFTTKKIYFSNVYYEFVSILGKAVIRNIVQEDILPGVLSALQCISKRGGELNCKY